MTTTHHTANPKRLPMSVPGMPAGDYDACIWMQAFAMTLSEKHEAYYVSREDTDRIVAVVQAFTEALDKHNDYWNRTKFITEAKNIARSNAAVALRGLIATLKADMRLTPTQLMAFGT